MPTLLFPGGRFDFASVLPQAQWLFVPPDGTLSVHGCTTQWRECRPGDVFVALSGPHEDGHELAQHAVRRGAAAVVTERLLPLRVPQVVVEDTRAAFARLCHALAGFPSRELTTVAVCGSAGKTSVALLLEAIFAAAGRPACKWLVPETDWNWASEWEAAIERLPAAASIAQRLARGRGEGREAALIELPDRLLAEQQASGVMLDAVVVTNLQGSAHSGQALRNVMARLERLWPQLKPQGVVVVNVDDPRCRRLQPSSRCLTFGVQTPADLTAEVLERWPSEQTFWLTAGGETAPVRTRLIGDSHLANCLAAAAAAWGCGIGLTEIVRGLEAVTHLPRRMERIECGQPYSIYLDAAATPPALVQAIRAVRQVVRGRTLVVFTPAAGLPVPHRPLVGRILERTAHLAILCGTAEGTGRPMGVLHDLLDGFEKPQRAHLIPSRRAAIAYALSLARPGDGVLIVGPQADQSDGPADEAAQIRQWLYAQNASERRCRKLRIVRGS